MWPQPPTKRRHGGQEDAVFMFVSRLIQRFKGSKGHVARVILGHTTKRPGHEDGTVAQSPHRIDAVQAPTCLLLRVNPRAVFINPCEEEINAETGISLEYPMTSPWNSTLCSNIPPTTMLPFGSETMPRIRSYFPSALASQPLAFSFECPTTAVGSKTIR